MRLHQVEDAIQKDKFNKEQILKERQSRFGQIKKRGESVDIITKEQNTQSNFYITGKTFAVSRDRIHIKKENTLEQLYCQPVDCDSLLVSRIPYDQTDPLNTIHLSKNSLLRSISRDPIFDSNPLRKQIMELPFIGSIGQ